MDSFYGGPQGVSFVIKERFSSVSAMIERFKDPNYKNVFFGEYCIIDTPNKNDKDNGKIYRRGFDTQNDMGGAILIGQVVGPSSGTPYFNLFESIEGVKAEAQKKPADGKTTHKRYPTGKDESGKYIISENGNGKDIASFEISTENTSLVPGKVNDETFNDKIKYTWLNIREDSADSDSWFYVGFEIPYLVTEFSTVQVDQYNSSGNFVEDVTKIDRIDDKTHPFYNKWQLSVPKGIKGDSFRNLRVIKLKDFSAQQKEEIIYDIKNFINKNGDLIEVPLEPKPYPDFEKDCNNGNKILVADFYIFDKVKSGKFYSVFLGGYNTIDSISTDNDGTVTIHYSYDSDQPLEHKLRWIENVALNTDSYETNNGESGVLTVNYNNGDEARPKVQKFNLQWVKDFNIAENGTTTTTYVGKQQNVETKKIKWINAIELNEEIEAETQQLSNSGLFKVTYNTEEVYRKYLQWIRDINVLDDGTIMLYKTAERKEDRYVEVASKNKVRWIKSITLNKGKLKVTYNEKSQEGQELFDEFNIDYINNVNILDNGTIQFIGASGEVLVEFPNKIQRIEAGTVDKNGNVIFNTNTGEKITLTDSTKENSNFVLRTIENTTLPSYTPTGVEEKDTANYINYLEAEKNIKIKYNTDPKNEFTKIGQPINSIQDIIVDSRWHLLVLFADPSQRYIYTTGDGKYPDSITVNNVTWINNVTGSNKINTGSTIYWRDYGAIKDEDGILIGLNVTDKDITSVTDNDTGQPFKNGEILKYLNQVYPNGLVATGLTGKVVTYAPSLEELQTSSKKFYACDYNKVGIGDNKGNPWYFLGEISDIGDRDVKFGSSYEGTIEGLNTKGLFFLTENFRKKKVSTLKNAWDPMYNPKV